MTLNTRLLAELCDTPAVSGAEDRMRAKILEHAEGFFDEKITDTIGNLVLVRKSRCQNLENNRKLAILCHMDEIGFQVSFIDDHGFIFVQPLGAFDPRTLFSRRVKVCTDNGDFRGVMTSVTQGAFVARHDNDVTAPSVSDFYIDLGLGRETLSRVSIGDFVVLDEPFLEIGAKIVSKALDNRLGCWLGIELLRALSDQNVLHNSDIYVAFTCQDEIGERGAKALNHHLLAHISLGVDATMSYDLPGVEEKNHVTVQGHGFGLHLKDQVMLADRELVRKIAEIATRDDIAFQKTMLEGGGPFKHSVQQNNFGAKTAAITVGTRYMHTPSEMIEKADLEAARRILIAFVGEN